MNRERVEKLKEMLASAGTDNFLEHALALEYIKAGDDNSARGLFESLLKRDPSYVGSYYHLGKLIERSGDEETAKRVYQEGMEQAKLAKDQHSYNELQGAFEDLEY